MRAIKHNCLAFCSLCAFVRVRPCSFFPIEWIIRTLPFFDKRLPRRWLRSRSSWPMPSMPPRSVLFLSSLYLLCILTRVCIGLIVQRASQSQSADQVPFQLLQQMARAATSASASASVADMTMGYGGQPSSMLSPAAVAHPTLGDDIMMVMSTEASADSDDSASAADVSSLSPSRSSSTSSMATLLAQLHEVCSE